jgi:hypothetical protein
VDPMDLLPINDSMHGSVDVQEQTMVPAVDGK